jgi:hypothetical protein
MAATAINSKIVRFEADVPVQVELLFTEGKEVTGKYGPQVFYSLSGGLQMYADPELAGLIDQLQIKRGQPIEIVKRQRGVWDVRRIEGAPSPRPPQSAPVAAPPVERPNLAPINPPAAGNTAFSRFCAAYKLAVDIAVETGKAKGVLMAAPRFEDIRTLAATIIIDMQKGGH